MARRTSQMQKSKPMFETPLDENLAMLTPWLVASPVRTFQRLADAPGFALARALVSGASSPDSLAKFDPVSCSWKTSQRSLDGTGYKSFVTLPKWGMTRDGELYQRPTPEPRIFESVFGWWPTPTASDTANRMPPKDFVITRNGTLRRVNKKGGTSFSRLSEVVRWVSPTAHDGSQSTLPPAALKRRSLTGQLARMGLRQDGMKLNPDWVESLMGLPSGWTDVTD